MSFSSRGREVHVSTERKTREEAMKDRLQTKLFERRLKKGGSSEVDLTTYCEEELSKILKGLDYFAFISLAPQLFERQAPVADRHDGRETRVSQVTNSGSGAAPVRDLPPIRWRNLIPDMDESFESIFERITIRPRTCKASESRSTKNKPLLTAFNELRAQFERLQACVERLPANALIQQPQRLGLRMSDSGESAEPGAMIADLSRLPKAERGRLSEVGDTMARELDWDGGVRVEATRMTAREHERSTKMGREIRQERRSKGGGGQAAVRGAQAERRGP